MDDDVRAELRSLRARAYGPDADIAADPAARQRLDELEALARPTPPPASTPDTERAVVPQPPVVAEASATLVEEPAEVVERPRGFAAPRWLPLVWVLSILAVAGVVAAQTYALAYVRLAPVDAAAGAVRVAVLSVDGDFVPPEAFGIDEGAVGYDEFHGLSVMRPSAGWGGAGQDACLAIFRTDDGATDNAFEGPVLIQCGAGAFRATVAFRVANEFPHELIERYPVGTALQFVLDGDRVVVYVDSASGRES